MMKDTRTTVRVSIDSVLALEKAFDRFIEELVTALLQGGMRLEPGSNGRILQGNLEVGRVISWMPGKEVRIQWRQANWQNEEVTEVEMRFEAIDGGTQLTLLHHGWGGLIGNPGEILGWFAGAVVTPLLQATAPAGLGNWLTDRRARRPSGEQSRAVYRDPLYHYPNFYAILAELKLSSTDYLIEIGCGGGAFLKEALLSGCRAAAIDHSIEMVQLAQEVNSEAVQEGRLSVQLASADRLPFPDGVFTCAVMTGVLGFLPDPVAALRELRRVLSSGGRLVALGSDEALRGTPAAPEPMASLLHFYSDEEFTKLALDAGFEKAEVVRRELLAYAQQAGVPREHLELFAGPGTSFLFAQKD